MKQSLKRRWRRTAHLGMFMAVLVGGSAGAETPKVSVYPKNPRSTPIREWRDLPPVDESRLLQNPAFQIFLGGTVHVASWNNRPELAEAVDTARIEGGEPVRAGANGFRFRPDEPQWLAVHAFWHLNRAHDYFRSLGHPSLDSRRYPEDAGASLNTTGKGNHVGWLNAWDLSEIVIGALWDLRDRLGRETTDRLYLAMIPRLSGASTFLEVRRELIAADQRLNAGSNAATIAEVFNHRGHAHQAKLASSD